MIGSIIPKTYKRCWCLKNKRQEKKDKKQTRMKDEEDQVDEEYLQNE